MGGGGGEGVRLVRGGTPSSPLGSDIWPLHEIFITNSVWCIVYKREFVGGVVYCPIIVHKYRNRVGSAGWGGQ